MAENYDDSMYKLTQDIEALENGDLVLAGIFADKPGYHNKRKNLPSTDYSVKYPADKKGPSDKAAAFDITSRSAQRGNYTIIKKYSNRLYAAGKNNDPRMYGWREFFGQTDNDGTVEGWDYVKNEPSTSSDKSHNWHIHVSELRQFIANKTNKEALLSVFKGESLEAYKARGGKLLGSTTPKPSTPTKPNPSTDVIEKGDTGQKVIRLQDFFRRVFPAYRNSVSVKRSKVITVDGDFGPQTEAWVKEFQKRTNLKQDGVVGPLTTAKLRKYGYQY